MYPLLALAGICRRPSAEGVIMSFLLVAPYILTEEGNSLVYHLISLSRERVLVTVALAPESICACGEVKSIVVELEDTEEVFVVGVVSAEQVDFASASSASEGTSHQRMQGAQRVHRLVGLKNE